VIGFLSGNKRIYAACPILISGTCKREDGHKHAELIGILLYAVKKELNAALNPHGISASIISVASDGETRRGKALVKLAMDHILPDSSPIAPILKCLDLMNFLVGDDDITADKDFRHVDKRIRNLLLHKRGIAVGDQMVTPPIIRRHLSDAGHSKEHLDSILRPNDLQDTMLTYHLINDIAALPPLDDTGSQSAGYCAARQALRILGKLFWYILYPYICVDLSLHEQLEYLSSAAFLALLLYRKSKQKFFPTLLYTDIMIMIKNAFFCFAKVKVDTPLGKFFLILLGTDRLETLFGILRTMMGNDANADILQLATRITGTTEVANILASHPEWDKTPRRLKYPSVSREGRVVELSDRSDHVSPATLNGDVTVPFVTAIVPWKMGRKRVEDDDEIMAVLRDEVELLNKDCSESPGTINILAPFGKLLITQPLDQNDNEDDDDFWCGPIEESGSDINRIAGAGFSHEVEDTVMEEVEAEEASGETTPKFVRYIVTKEGAKLNKAHALALRIRDTKSSSSTDCLRRVQQVSRFAMTPTVEGVESVFGAPSLLVGDPIASMIRCEGKVFLAVGEVISISISNNAVEEVALELLSEDIVTITYQVVHLTPAAELDDPTLENDWRSRRRMNGAPTQCTVPGRLVQSINPTVVKPKDGPSKSFYLFNSTILLNLAAHLMESSSLADGRKIPNLARSPVFPYLFEGRACFAMELDSRETLPAEDVCPACEKPTPIDITNPQMVLAHMGAHVLFDPRYQHVSEPCRLCLSPAPMCHFTLMKGKGADYGMQIDMKNSRCIHLGKKFSYHIASESTRTSPCSNVPVRCPLCDPKALCVWRYHLRDHFLKKHQSGSLKDYLERMGWKLGEEERKRMKRVWKDRYKITKKRVKKKKGVTPLQVSDRHSTRMALRYSVCDYRRSTLTKWSPSSKERMTLMQ
jgi:hypothetical protein